MRVQYNRLNRKRGAQWPGRSFFAGKNGDTRFINYGVRLSVSHCNLRAVFDPISTCVSLSPRDNVAKHDDDDRIPGIHSVVGGREGLRSQIREYAAYPKYTRERQGARIGLETAKDLVPERGR